jgi:5-methylcytosine-specific restriction endonuclease McrA
MIGEYECELCGRTVEEVTKHHLIPRTRHANKKNKREFDRTEIHTRLALLCRPCHKQVHAVLTEKQLERDHNTLESLKAHEKIAKFIDWIKDKPADTQVIAHYNRKKGR